MHKKGPPQFVPRKSTLPMEELQRGHKAAVELLHTRREFTHMASHKQQKYRGAVYINITVKKGV